MYFLEEEEGVNMEREKEEERKGGGEEEEEKRILRRMVVSRTLRRRAGRGLAGSLPVRSQPRFPGHLFPVPRAVLSSQLELCGSGRKVVSPRPPTAPALSLRRTR